MAEQAQGLRFDIYERVHLSEEVNGIDRLEEIELLPHIQVVSQHEQAVLKGHLLLSGTFASDQAARGGGSLEHAIPVEITLPMNRIPNLNDISVEIENFDIDLVSPHTLNVTGVLSLNGIEVLPVANEWNPREEAEDVFVHKAAAATQLGETQLGETAAFRAERQAEEPMEPFAEPAPEPIAEPIAQPIEEPAEEKEPFAKPAVDAEPFAAEGWPQPTEDWTQDDSAEEESFDAREDRAVADGQEAAAEVEEADAEASQDAEAAPDKKELKIAFSPMPREEGNISSLLPSSDGAREPQAKAASRPESEPEAEEKEPRSARALGWKSLFLSQASDEPRFSSLRMCIVQKEETIESIAERYSLRPNELALYNRLSDASVREGQVIYIPK